MPMCLVCGQNDEYGHSSYCHVGEIETLRARVAELEAENADVLKVNDEQRGIMGDYQRECDRYREALEKIANAWCGNNVDNIARAALNPKP